MTTVIRPVGIAEGERSVAIAAPVRGAMIVTGDHNTVEMRLTGLGGVLAFAFRWHRPRPRPRRDRGHACPPRFDNHVDRDEQIAALLPVDGAPRVVNVYGEPGIGKTHVLVEALNHDECAMRDGTVYLDGRDQSADDLLHAVFDELYECRVQRRDLRIERLLSTRRALVALENVELAPDAAQRLALGAPRCRLLVTSRSRVLYDATPVGLAGLAPEHAAAIAEQELGRSLGPRERMAAESIGTRLDGHPLELRRLFSRARDEGRGRPLDELEEWLLDADGDGQRRRATLSPAGLRAARALAVYGGAAIAGEHLRVIAGPDAVEGVDELEASHDVRSHAGRHRLVGVLALTLPQGDLSDEVDRALAHLTGWAEVRATDSEALLREGAALLALLARAHATDRWAQVIRLGRAIESAYALGQRWADWGRVIELVLDAARRCEDLEAEGWARHQLGTRAFGLGRIDDARASLHEALALRERIGDSAGAAATRQNLSVVSGSAPLLHRLSHLSLTLVAVVCTLMIGAAGVAGADIIASGGGGETVGPEVVVGVQGDGIVVSQDASIRCAEPYCRAERPRNSELLLRARPERGWEFARWTGACSGRGTCRLLLTADTGAVAIFKPVRDPREVAVSVQGKGTVVSHPAGLECQADEDCRVTFTRSRELELTAAAASGHRFTGWSRDCEGTERCVIDGDSQQTIVRASFVADAEAVSLTVDLRGTGLGQVTSRQSGIACGTRCAAGFRRGASVLLSAVAQPGSSFSGWGDPQCARQTGPTCTVELDRSRGVVARFTRLRPLPGSDDIEALVAAPDKIEKDDRPPNVRPPQAPAIRNLVVTATGSGRGTVTSAPSGIDCGVTCKAPFAHGQSVTLAAAGINSQFIGWSGAGCSGTGACVVTLDDAKSVEARFDPNPPPRQILAVAVTGKGRGSVTSRPAGLSCEASCKAAFGKGQDVTLTATGIDSDFAGWTGAGCSGTGACVVTLDDAKSVEARFDLKPPPMHELTVTKTGSGQGTVTSEPRGVDCGATCTASLPEGQKVVLTTTAGANSVFVGWSGAECPGTGACLVTVDRARSVGARFDTSSGGSYLVRPPS